MSSLSKTLLLIVLAVAALIYIVPAALLSWYQSAVIFPAPEISRQRLASLAVAAGARELSAPTADGVALYGWHVPADGQRAFLYFHGNGESVAHTQAIQRAVVAAGWDFVCVSPRGYPGSGGAPSAGSIAADAQAAWSLVTGPLGFAPGAVLVHGRSLGGGLAGTLMADIEPAGLVLESTFRSLVDVGRSAFPLYPIRLLLRHRAPTESQAAAVRYPVLVLHGDRDRVIPVAHGRALAARFPDATYIEAQGFGHNDNLLFADPAVHRAWSGYLARAR